jgi:hypothetical protein
MDYEEKAQQIEQEMAYEKAQYRDKMKSLKRKRRLFLQLAKMTEEK